MSRALHQFPVVASPSNCPRCGKEYLDYIGGRSRVCPSCKKPKPPGMLRGSNTRKVHLVGQPLTVRESQIVDLVAMGLLNKEIASCLHLAEGTIKVFMGDIFLKTGADNRTKLAIWRITGKLPA